MNQNLHSQKMQGFLFDFFNNGFKMEKNSSENCIYKNKDGKPKTAFTRKKIQQLTRPEISPRQT